MSGWKWVNLTDVHDFFHESRLRGIFFITINEIKIQITKYITKYITNHNTNRDLEMKIRTFTEIGSYVDSDNFSFIKISIVKLTGRYRIHLITSCAMKLCLK